VVVVVVVVVVAAVTVVLAVPVVLSGTEEETFVWDLSSYTLGAEGLRQRGSYIQAVCALN
jgi:hypothetical protein